MPANSSDERSNKYFHPSGINQSCNLGAHWHLVKLARKIKMPLIILHSALAVNMQMLGEIIHNRDKES